MTLQDHDINSAPCIPFRIPFCVVYVFSCRRVYLLFIVAYQTEYISRKCFVFGDGVCVSFAAKFPQKSNKPSDSSSAAECQTGFRGGDGGDDDDDNGAYYCNKNDITYEPIGDNE